MQTIKLKMLMKQGVGQEIKEKIKENTKRQKDNNSK